MVADNKKTWEHGQVTCASTTVPQLIAKLHGGESITLKSLATAGEYHYIGKNRKVSSSTGYLMDSGDTITFSHDISFGRNSVIEIWALPTNANDVICYFKLIDSEPVTGGG